MKLTPRLETLLQLGKFLFVGVVNTAVGLGSILILINFIGVQYQIANIIGYAFGVACGFSLNKYLAFAYASKRERKNLF